MNLQTILAVMGVIATVFFGIWAIVVTFQSTKKVQITFAIDRCTTLLHDLNKSLNDLIIQYKNNPVGENLLLLRGYFINTGTRDISPDMVEKEINMIIPDNFQLVEIKITESSPSLHADISSFNDSNCIFHTGLWKVKEYFGFDALVNVLESKPDESSSQKLRTELKFEHRISDLNKILQERLYREEEGALNISNSLLFPLNIIKKTKFTLILATITILMGIGISLIPKLGLGKELGYKVTLDDKSNIVTAYVRRGSLTLRGDGDFKKKVSLVDFQKAFSGEFNIVPARDPFYPIAALTYIIMGGIMGILSILKGYRQGRLRKFIKIENKVTE